MNVKARKTKNISNIIQNSAEWLIKRYRRLSRVLEKKPVNQMECEMHYISTKTKGRL